MRFFLFGTRKHPNWGLHVFFGLLFAMQAVGLWASVKTGQWGAVANIGSAAMVLVLLWAGVVFYRRIHPVTDEERDLL